MRQPSKKSLVVAGEILDHVNYGLTRPDIIREWAEVIDEHNVPLLEAACDLIDSAETNQGIPDNRYIEKLRAVLAEYQPQQANQTSRTTGTRPAPRTPSRLAN
jgi:hypothetical protein